MKHEVKKTHKLRIGDRVQLKASYIDWLIAWIPEGYSVSGRYKPSELSNSELLALFCAREFKEPMRGEVLDWGWDSPSEPTVKVRVSNQYGTYTSHILESNLTRLKKRPRCKKCGEKQ